MFLILPLLTLQMVSEKIYATRCGPVVMPIAPYSCADVSFTPLLSSATARQVASNTRCSPTKPVFRHFAHTRAWSDSFGFCVALRKQRLSRSRPLRRMYTGLTWAATSGHSRYLMLPLWSPGCFPAASAFWKKHKLSFPYGHLSCCGSASVNDTW